MEEERVSLFINDMIPYIENPQDTTENYSSAPMNSAKLQDTKLTQRNLLDSYILTTKDQKKKLRKQSHLPSHQK